VSFAGDVDAVVAELRPLVQGDGADFIVADVDDDARAVTLRLALDGVECPDCVMPHDFLYDIISTAFRDRIEGVSVVLDDPRVTAE
jgi:Fe-S cluster biogenesis protein NfuA